MESQLTEDKETLNGEDVKFKTRSQTMARSTEATGNRVILPGGGSGPQRAARPLTSASVKLRTAPAPPPTPTSSPI